MGSIEIDHVILSQECATLERTWFSVVASFEISS